MRKREFDLTHVDTVANMDSQEIAVLEMAIMRKKKLQQILKQHNQAITQGSDGRWRTKIKLPNGKLRDVKKATRAELEDYLIEYYEHEGEHQTVKNLFDVWIKNKKELDGLRASSIARYNTDFRRFFTDDDEFCSMEISEITPADITAFIKRQIKTHELTHKTYGGLRILIAGIFCLAKEQGITDISMAQYFGDLRIPKNLFAHKEQKDEEDVFTEEEKNLLLSWLRTEPTLLRLGLVLMFQTGLRVGELSTLKREDIDFNEHVIYIRRTEISYDNEKGKRVIGVSEEAKTEAGNRKVVFPDAAIKTLKQIILLSPFSEYLFSYPDGRRIHGKAFRDQTYRACKAVNIPERSTHKIRKTYLTELVDGGASDSLIESIGGHKSIATTRRHYLRDHMTTAEKLVEINRIVNG